MKTSMRQEQDPMHILYVMYMCLGAIGIRICIRVPCYGKKICCERTSADCGTEIGEEKAKE
jgi:hypothetical protein